jgi:hypothetical protein
MQAQEQYTGEDGGTRLPANPTQDVSGADEVDATTYAVDLDVK